MRCTDCGHVQGQPFPARGHVCGICNYQPRKIAGLGAVWLVLSLVIVVVGVIAGLGLAYAW